MMTLDEARQLIAEYDALPDDLTQRIIWQDERMGLLPKIPLVCRECGAHYKDFECGWGEVRWHVERNEAFPDSLKGYCPKHAPPADDDDD